VLISLSHKFMFVANVKTGSTTLEAALSPKCEIAISKTHLGKHDHLGAISKKFSWIRRYVPFDKLFVFGVVRDPVDWLVSLYNSHSKPEFDNQPSSTKDMPFSTFLHDGYKRRWQMRPQNLRFIDNHDRLHLSHLIDFAALDDEFPKLCNHLGLPAIALRKHNVSPLILRREELTESDFEFIHEKYADDFALLQDRPRLF